MPEANDGLDAAEGRDFEEAVAEGFRKLGLRAERVEEIQGESDVLIFANFCEEPYGVVVECQAKTGPAQVGSEKVGQIRSHFSRYLSRFGFATKVFLLVVGRPSFSDDCVKDSKLGPGKESAGVGVALLAAHDLKTLLRLHENVPITQEDLRDVFSKDGEASRAVLSLESRHKRILGCYAAVLAIVDIETRESGKTIARLDLPYLTGQVSLLLRMRGHGKVQQEMISRAVTDLSSPIFDLLRVEGTTARRTSHKIPDGLANFGKAGMRIVEEYDQMSKFLKEAKA